MNIQLMKPDSIVNDHFTILFDKFFCVRTDFSIFWINPYWRFDYQGLIWKLIPQKLELFGKGMIQLHL